MKPKFSFNNETIKLMSLFEKITRSKLNSCFDDNNGVLTFVVETDELRKAIGKGAENVKKIEALLKKKIRIIEYQDNIKKFIKSLIFPMRIKNIILGDYENLSLEEKANSIITLESVDRKTRGLLIGRNASNLRNYEFIVKKFFPIKEIKIL